MARATDQFTNTNKFLSHYFQNIITEYRTDLQTKLHLIQLYTADTLAEERALLELALNRGGTASVNHLRVLREIELPGTLDRILVNAQNLIDISRLEMTGMRDKIELLNPLKLLKVGYTMSSIDHIDLAHYSGAYIGKELQTLTDQFTIYSTITKIKK
jgi:hypothetical protein